MRRGTYEESSYTVYRMSNPFTDDVLTCNCWMRADIADRGLIDRLLRALAETLPETFPTRWGQNEPFRIRASHGDYRDALDLAAHYNRFVFGVVPRTKNLLFIDSFVNIKRKPFTASLMIDPARPKIKGPARGARVVSLFAQWSELLAPDFCRCCTYGEWRKKNTIEFFYDEDGSIINPKVYNADINEGLPGVYWLTYFGKELAEWFTPARLAAAPWPYVTELAGGYLLRRSDDPNAWQSETALDEQLIDHLGRNRFFDIREPNRKIEGLEFRLPMSIVERYRESAPAIAVPSPRRRKAKDSLPVRKAREEDAVDAKAEVESLMSEGMPFAEQMLSKHDEFYPFAVVMSADGNIEHNALAADVDASAAGIYEQLESVLGAGANTGRYRATAIFADRKVKRPTDSKEVEVVQVALEHQSGYAVNVFFPYTKTADGQLTIDEPFASDRPMTVFSQESTRK